MPKLRDVSAQHSVFKEFLKLRIILKKINNGRSYTGCLRDHVQRWVTLLLAEIDIHLNGHSISKLFLKFNDLQCQRCTQKNGEGF